MDAALQLIRLAEDRVETAPPAAAAPGMSELASSMLLSGSDSDTEGGSSADDGEKKEDVFETEAAAPGAVAPAQSDKQPSGNGRRAKLAAATTFLGRLRKKKETSPVTSARHIRTSTRIYRRQMVNVEGLQKAIMETGLAECINRSKSRLVISCAVGVLLFLCKFINVTFRENSFCYRLLWSCVQCQRVQLQA